MGRRLAIHVVVLTVLVSTSVVVAPARSVAARSIEASSSSLAAARVAPEQPRLLVTFRPGATATQRDAAISSVGGTVDRVLDRIAVTRVAIPVPADPASDAVGLTALRLARDPAVLSVEPDSTGAVQFTPNDPYWLTDPTFGIGQWGLRATQVDKAWDVVRGSPQVIVAVIDTGIDPNHPDLAGVMLPGVTFLSSPDPSCPAGSVIDDNGHGTHVAGLIGANGNNGQGVAGVAFGVRILPVKSLDCTGAGLLSDVASGVTWATDHGARIINISLGSSSAQQALRSAIQYAVAHNVLVVAAAGNCGMTSARCATANEPQYPGAFPETLAVAATDQGDAHAPFSNVGAYVGISAPGVRIWSTTPTYPTTLSRTNPSLAGYAPFSGTSQASPIVAGIAALVLSGEPALSAAQLADRLRTTADDVGAPGPDAEFGAGRINALRAVTTGAAVRYGAAYDVTSVPKVATISAPVTAPVIVSNLSSFAWPAGGTNPVRLGYHWSDIAGNTVVWDGQRSTLPADVPIGGTATVNATIAAPKTPGTYVLRLDLVREGVSWFSTSGIATGNVTVGVTSGLAASYAPAASAQSTFVLGPNAFTATVSNTGTVTWPAAGATPVHLSYHWLGPDGRLVVWEGTRANLPSDLAPGQSAVVTINVGSPPATGPYTLRLDLVQEGVSWFSGQGVVPRDLAINVTNGFGATYTGPPPATSFLPGSRAVLSVTLTNTGLLAWPASGPNPVRLAAHVFDLSDRVLLWDGERSVLAADVAPGQSVTLPVAVAVPASATAAKYLVRFDLVREGVAWFSSYGVAPGFAGIVADTDYRASLALGSTTISRSAPSVTVTVTNPSQVAWTRGGSAPLDLGSHWLAADGTPLVWDGPRVPLVAAPAASIDPGAVVSITLPLAAPPPGAALLVVDIVAEGLRWFGSGSPTRVTLVP
jgi:subtilisin family serine protease